MRLKNIFLFIDISLCWLYAGCAGLPITPIEPTEEQINYERVGEVILFADLDGDEYRDLIICVSSYNSNRGKIYIFYGRNLDSKGRITTPTWADAAIEGENEQDKVGEFVFTGDLNRDKKDDLIIGLPNANSNKGKIYIFYGGRITGRYSISEADAVIVGENEGDRIGEYISIVNFNKKDEIENKKDYLIITVLDADSNKGKIYIFYGYTQRFTNSISNANLIIK